MAGLEIGMRHTLALVPSVSQDDHSIWIEQISKHLQLRPEVNIISFFRLRIHSYMCLLNFVIFEKYEDDENLTNVHSIFPIISAGQTGSQLRS